MLKTFLPLVLFPFFTHKMAARCLDSWVQPTDPPILVGLALTAQYATLRQINNR